MTIFACNINILVTRTCRLVEGADDRRAVAEGRLPRHADGGDAARDREGGALPEREGERVALGVRVLQARRAAPARAQLIAPAAAGHHLLRLVQFIYRWPHA